jgi:phosphate transport system substrate-binding protein
MILAPQEGSFRTRRFALMNIRKFAIAASLSAAAAIPAVSFADIDPALPDYSTVSGVSGNLNSIGSDTLNNLMTLWAETFQGLYPNVNIQIQGAGSGTAPPAVTEGTANLGPMSRGMRSNEIQAFEQRHGYPPTEVGVAIDMVAVYVNKDNPIQCLSIPQVDAIFSVGRRCGHGNDITRWGQVGMTGAWANRDFTVYSRNAVSGTYGYFKDNALCGGDFKPSINEQPGSSAVVQGVAESINGIGYSGIGYITSGVRAVPLAKEEGGTCVPATAEAGGSGEFPLARFLYIYVNKHPNRPLPPLEREFFRMVLAKPGQEVVLRDGYVPLPASAAKRFGAALGL